MESKEDMIAVIKIIGIATSIGKAGIDFDEGQKQCKEVMKDFEAQIRQDQKKKDCYICWCADKNTQPTDLSDLIMEAK